MTDVARHLPLKPVAFHILLSLMEGDLHGYGMVKAIETQSAGRLRLEPGNLYRHIRRLEADNMVEPSGRRSTPEEGNERRRYYAVTSLGREVLAAEAARMRSLAAAAQALEGLAKGGAR